MDDDNGLEGLHSRPPKAEVVGPSGTLYSGTAIFVLKVYEEPRRSLIKFIEEPLFDPIILLTILANCMTMAWESPLDEPGTTKAGFINLCEWMFLLIFTVEMLSKIVALGFLPYLRDGWCRLDFVVVVVAWIPIFFPSLAGYSIIRAMRAFRPLRALRRLPGMPILINAILLAIPKLRDVLMLCVLMMVVMGGIGTGSFKGALHFRCARVGYVEPPIKPLADPRMTPAGHLPNNAFDTGIFCNPRSRKACALLDADAAGATCRYFHVNPNAGTTSFDTFGSSVLLLIQAVTFDDFSMPMYALMDAMQTPLVVLFWITAVVFGGFFLANLFLAVLFQVLVSCMGLGMGMETSKIICTCIGTEMRVHGWSCKEAGVLLQCGCTTTTWTLGALLP